MCGLVTLHDGLPHRPHERADSQQSRPLDRRALRPSGHYEFHLRNDRSHLPGDRKTRQMVATAPPPPGRRQLPEHEAPAVRSVAQSAQRPLAHGPGHPQRVRPPPGGRGSRDRPGTGGRPARARRTTASSATTASGPTGRSLRYASTVTCPCEQMTHIYLDHHSRTSVMLTRLLLEEYWQHPVDLPHAGGRLHRPHQRHGRGTGHRRPDHRPGQTFSVRLRPGHRLEGAYRPALRLRRLGNDSASLSGLHRRVQCGAEGGARSPAAAASCCCPPPTRILTWRSTTPATSITTWMRASGRRWRGF